MQRSRRFEKPVRSWRIGDWKKCTLYVTLEPCQMCAGAIVQARISRVVVGVYEPEKRAVPDLFLNLLQVPAFNHQAELVTGVRGEECSQMMKQFFKRTAPSGRNRDKNK